MTVNKAKRLYDKLSPFLRVEEPWGCYPPKRNGRHKLADWPLSHWRGPGTSPLCFSWAPHSDRPPTFAQFCLVYRIDLVEVARS